MSLISLQTADIQDPTVLRQLLGRFPTGVTAVCCATSSGPVGMAVSSFAPVSLDPPIVSFCAGNGSSTWRELSTQGVVAISFLAAAHGDLCRQLARRGEDRFDGVELHAAPSGAPVIAGSTAWLDGRIWQRHEAGDHVLVLVKVTAGAVNGDIDPLVFFASGFSSLRP